MRALHAETTFHYGTGTTRAVDGLGRTTTFHRATDGITTGGSATLGHTYDSRATGSSLNTPPP